MIGFFIPSAVISLVHFYEDHHSPVLQCVVLLYLFSRSSERRRPFDLVAGEPAALSCIDQAMLLQQWQFVTVGSTSMWYSDVSFFYRSLNFHTTGGVVLRGTPSWRFR